MTMFLVDHLPGCTPAARCASCEAMAFLQKNLTPEQYRSFERILKNASSPHGDILRRPWEEVFELSFRVQTALRMDQRNTVADIVRMTKQEFNRTPNIGKLSVQELEEALTAHGLRFGMKVPGDPSNSGE